MKILADETLPHLTELFTPPFSLTLYNKQNEVAPLLPSHDILLCRSTLQVTAGLLTGSQLQGVATASSGIDHIDNEYLLKHGIPLFDAKGCNARAVADYVVASAAFLYRNHLIIGNKAGVIGVGEVGAQVVARLCTMGFDVWCYDPLREKRDNDYHYCSLLELTTCDLICVHANLHDNPPFPSVNLIASDFLSQLKPGAAIINAARGGIIDEEALLKTERPITYCTDVYRKEPTINAELVDFAALCTPHIAGHSIEAKSNAVLKISQQLHCHFKLPTSLKRTSQVETHPIKTLNNATHGSSWQDIVLALYNPLIDTCILKNATDKTNAFLKQRQAHQSRHDFSFYDARECDKLTQSLLGQSIN